MEIVLIIIFLLLPVWSLWGFWYHWKRGKELQEELDKAEEELQALKTQREKDKNTILEYDRKHEFYHSVPEIHMAITKALMSRINRHGKMDYTPSGKHDISDKDIPGMKITTDLQLNTGKKSLRDKNLTPEETDKLLDEYLKRNKK